MTEWLRDRFSLSVDEANLIVAIVAIIVPVLVGSAVPAIRNRLVATWRQSGFKAAILERRYSRWFVATHRKVYNLYLDMYDFASSQGWVRSRTENGPIKYTDENGIVRVTIKRGSGRTPGSEDPHVEMRNAQGDRIDASGNVVTRKSPRNHTPIEYDLP